LLEDLEAVKIDWNELGRSGACPTVGVVTQEAATNPCDGMAGLGKREWSGAATIRRQITVSEDWKFELTFFPSRREEKDKEEKSLRSR